MEKIISFQYTPLPEGVLKSEIARICNEHPEIILHTLHRSRNRLNEKLFANFPDQPISTTVGYWTEEDLKSKKNPLIGTQALRLKKGLFYSVDPAAIRFQIERSLENTKHSQLDYVWIEDPDLIPHPLPEALQKAQDVFETLRNESKIKHWGWIVRSPKIFESVADHPELLPKCFILHFNPFETHLFQELKTLSKTAKQIWIDRGFSAVISDRLFPLYDTNLELDKSVSSKFYQEKLKSQLEACLKLEPNNDGWAHQLSEHWAQIPDSERWESLKREQFLPALEERKKWDNESITLLETYESLFQVISDYFKSIESEFLDRWQERLKSAGFTGSARDSLYQFYQGIPGVTGVLLETETLLNQNWPKERFEKISNQEVIRKLSELTQ